MSSSRDLLQSELPFRTRSSDSIWERIPEPRRSRLQRITDWLSTAFLLPFLKGLLAVIEASRVLSVIPSPVWMIGSMLVSIAVYSSRMGWSLAWGFITLLMIHECGHLLAARYYGARMSVPIFIPFIGALINMKEPMRNAWHEAVFGMAGPVLGSLGACICWVIAGAAGSFYFSELAIIGFFLNLFNLIPLGFLDGGHIAVVLTRWLWIPGYLMMAAFAWFVHSPVVLILLAVMLPMVLSLFKKRTRKQRDYDTVSLGKRLSMGALYIGLVVFLAGSISWIFIKNIHPALKSGKHLTSLSSGPQIPSIRK
ncbi:MAG: site-2 protease family protein [Chthoniobacterales bacterium]|nr:site-2 protease family protein [Chthoniobacterales bacterium]